MSGFLQDFDNFYGSAFHDLDYTCYIAAMKILGIETSCDETAAAIVEDGRKVLANVIYSQIHTHQKTGGVVPEVAAREHILKMIPVLDQCIKGADCSWDDIDAIAVTRGPGLISSLLVGTETASAISYVKNKMLIPVHHISGHLYSAWLDCEEEVNLPILTLTVSGGHNELILIKDHFEFEVLGETLDDASGEAFDKVARLIGLGYPGGPVIAKAALNGNKERFALPRAWMAKDSLDFSFSGLKTAVLDLLRGQAEVDEQFKNDLAASFQEAVVDVLAGKLMRAYAKHSDVKEIHLVGGVSANLRLREVIAERLAVVDPGNNVKFRYPKAIPYCTDNAAMIAGAAYFLYKKNPQDFHANTNVVADLSFDI